MWNCSKVLHRQIGPGLFAVKRENISFPRGSLMRFRQQSFPQAAMCVKWMWWRLRTSCLCKRQNARRQHSANQSEQERIRMEIVSNFHAGAAPTLRKKRGFSVCSVADSRSRDYPSNPHFHCGIALSGTTAFFPRNGRPYGVKRKAFHT